MVKPAKKPGKVTPVLKDVKLSKPGRGQSHFVPPSRDELRKTLATEKPGSAKAYQAAVKMLDYIEQDAQQSKSRKVVYFPPMRDVQRPLNQEASARVENVAKVHPKLAKQVKARELPEIPQVTLAEICKELKKDATEVRKMLRDKKVPKPGTQWAWPKTDEKNIKLIRGLIKTMPKQ